VSQWTLGAGGVHKGHPYPSRDGGEGGEDAVHTPSGDTYVTEKHFFLVKGTLTHLALCIIRRGAGKGGDEGRLWARERLRVGVWKSEIGVSR